MIPEFQVEMIHESARKAARQLLEKHQETLCEAGIFCKIRATSGFPRQVVCHIANEENFSIIVLGRGGAGEIRDVLFGTISNYALHNVNCPVLLF
jgi:nucleotide-binding universal stress UspA family protein